VQCKTVLQDAWANVSHYLAYKGEASIPVHLRRDFYALAGLFYVADRHFQLFFQEAIASREQTLREAAQGQLEDDVPADLDTVTALFSQLYPDRRHVDESDVSVFVEEVANFGYQKIGSLRDALRRGLDGAIRYEADYPPTDLETMQRTAYTDLGFARQALAVADPNYAAQSYPGDKFELYREGPASGPS
jgi:hypothetical protein